MGINAIQVVTNSTGAFDGDQVFGAPGGHFDNTKFSQGYLTIDWTSQGASTADLTFKVQGHVHGVAESTKYFTVGTLNATAGEGVYTLLITPHTTALSGNTYTAVSRGLWPLHWRVTSTSASASTAANKFAITAHLYGE